MTEKKITFKDIIALLKMSCWSAYWKINGKAALTGGWFTLRHPLFCILVLFAAGYLICHGFWFAAPFLFFNPFSIARALLFYKSTWYKNTGITPGEVVADQGTYGEYLSTCYMEDMTSAAGGRFRIYNRLLIPSSSGKITEVDGVVVGENIGVHVLETKCRGGHFYGNASSRIWSQYIGRESYSVNSPLYQNQWHVKAIREGVMSSAGINLSGRIINVVLFALKDAAWTISDASSFHAKFILAPAERYPKLMIEGCRLSAEEYERIIKYFDSIEERSSRSAHEEFVNRKI